MHAFQKTRILITRQVRMTFLFLRKTSVYIVISWMYFRCKIIKDYWICWSHYLVEKRQNLASFCLLSNEASLEECKSSEVGRNNLKKRQKLVWSGHFWRFFWLDMVNWENSPQGFHMQSNCKITADLCKTI